MSVTADRVISMTASQVKFNFISHMKSISKYILLAMGLALIIEPLLPQYHLSLFWFSLSVISIIISLRDLIKKV